MKNVVCLAALLAPTDAFLGARLARSATTLRAAKDELGLALEDLVRVDAAEPESLVVDEEPRSTEPLERALARGGTSLATGFVTAEAKDRAQWLDRVFGFADEDALKKAPRAGQSSWVGAIDVAEADPLGLEDEARTTAEVEARAFAPDPFLLRDDAPLPGGVGGQVGYVDALGLAGAAGGAPAIAGVRAPARAPPRAAPSVALPFLPRPAALDAVAPMAGDAGFDPLGLATAQTLPALRDAELKHARLAMLAAVGWPASEAVQPALARALELPSTVAERGGLAPSVLNGGLDDVPVPFWVSAIVATVVVELVGLQRRAAGAAPGDLGFDPLKLNSPFMAEYELANGRVAMLAITAFAAQEFATKLAGIPIPVIHELP